MIPRNLLQILRRGLAALWIAGTGAVVTVTAAQPTVAIDTTQGIASIDTTQRIAYYDST